MDSAAPSGIDTVARDAPASKQPDKRPVEQQPRPAESAPAGDRAEDKEDKEDKKDDAAQKPQPGLRDRIRQHPIAAIGFAALIVAAIIAVIAWYLHARHFESTDDAFIDTRSVLISPQVSGTIVQVAVTDNQVVKAGALLARIDPRDYKATSDSAAAQIRQAEANIRNVDAQIETQKSQIDQAAKQVAEAQAALDFAQDENVRYQDLVQKGAGTLQRAQQASSDLQGKQASLYAAVAAKISADRRIDVLTTQREVVTAQLDQSRAQKEQADANLGRTELHATVDGRIAKLTAAVGALATPAQAIMVLVPLEVWVTANFKESQLADMRVGQPVDVAIDAYRRSFPGRVNSVQAGSGVAFSLLPAENATGNYVKVVQRVPVKITFDTLPDVQLGPGLSVVPTVTVR